MPTFSIVRIKTWPHMTTRPSAHLAAGAARNSVPSSMSWGARTAIEKIHGEDRSEGEESSAAVFVR